MDIKIHTFGEEPLPPLSSFTLSQIALGLELPSQGASKSMAIELLEAKGLDKFGNPLREGDGDAQGRKL